MHNAEQHAVVLDNLQSAIFEHLPLPTIVLRQDFSIILINNACKSLFKDADSLLDRRLDVITTRWRKWNSNSEHRDTVPYSEFTGPEHGAHGILRFEVDLIDQQAHSPNKSANLHIASCSIADNLFWTVSFTDVAESHLTYQSNDITPSPKELVSQTQATSDFPNTGLNSRFTELRDAVYYNKQPGFLLSADCKFAFPHYKAGDDVEPVEVTDVIEFLSDWNIWDEHFIEATPVSEYPSLWIHAHRKSIRCKRLGLKEDNKNFVLEVSGDPLYSKDQSYIGNVVWITNLGEYADVIESDWEASHRDFRVTCDRLPHLLWSVDVEGKADYFSQSWYDFTGLTSEASLEYGFTQAIHVEDMQVVWSAFYEAKLTQSEVVREARYRHHSGQWTWMSVRAKPLINSSGSIVKWYGTSTNVHALVEERIGAERKRKQMMEMLSLTSIGLFEITPQRELNVLEGRLEWLPEHQKSFLLATLAQTCGDELTILTDHVHTLLDGNDESVTFEAEVKGRVYKYRLISDVVSGENEQKMIFGCSVDITEQRNHARLERENQKLSHTTALEMEKNRLKSSFLAHISHELRSPIAGILGSVDMLADEALGIEPRECIDNIALSATNLLTIVNDLLDLSKIEAGQMTYLSLAYDINAVIRETIQVFYPVAKAKGLDQICDILPSVTHQLLGDSGKVKQILANMISNALKFTFHGHVKTTIKRDSKYVEIRVQDTGIGIADEVLPQLFKPFVQADSSTARSFGGTGLGLAISRDLAQGMGGTLHLESVLGVGTTAVLILPNTAVQQTAAPDVTAKPPANKVISRQAAVPVRQVLQNPVKEHSARILVVEDNAINQKVALHTLRKLGFGTHAVWNGQEALDYLEKVSEDDRPSLILMDCQMPILDGYQATKQLRTDAKYARVNKLPVIALTASAIHGDEEKCQAAGMDGYMTKPVSVNILRNVLEQWVGAAE